MILNESLSHFSSWSDHCTVNVTIIDDDVSEGNEYLILKINT